MDVDANECTLLVNVTLDQNINVNSEQQRRTRKWMSVPVVNGEYFSFEEYPLKPLPGPNDPMRWRYTAMSIFTAYVPNFTS